MVSYSVEDLVAMMVVLLANWKVEKLVVLTVAWKVVVMVA